MKCPNPKCDGEMSEEDNVEHELYDENGDTIEAVGYYCGQCFSEVRIPKEGA